MSKTTTPFVPVEDPVELKNDPVLSRMMTGFDALRRRGVGADQASRSMSQVFLQSITYGTHPTQPHPLNNIPNS